MGWETWTDERWKTFIEENAVDGGDTERVPETIYLHCRGCNEKLSRERTPLFQLCWAAHGGSSFYCVPCARHLPMAQRATEPEQREATWMQFEQRLEPRHRRQDGWAD